MFSFFLFGLLSFYFLPPPPSIRGVPPQPIVRMPKRCGRGLKCRCACALKCICACVLRVDMSVTIPLSGPTGLQSARRPLFTRSYVRSISVLFLYTITPHRSALLSSATCLLFAACVPMLRSTTDPADSDCRYPAKSSRHDFQSDAALTYS